MEKPELTDEMCREAKDKGDLRSIEDSFVKKVIEKRLSEHFLNKVRGMDFVQVKKTRDYLLIFKSVRADLRNAYGLFVIGKYKKRGDAFRKLTENPNIENHNKILALHKSTKERLEYYPFLYEQIFAITGKPEKILDLGCGLNPFSYPFLDCRPEYSCCEISRDDCALIQRYFDSMDIKGTAFCFDLCRFKKTEFADYLSGDLCLMLKIADTIENQEKNITGKIIEGLKFRTFVVSFSKKSISGKAEIKERAWFERLLRDAGYRYETIEIPDEKFYIVFKEP